VRSVAGALEWTSPNDGTTVHIVPKANGWLSAPTSQTTEFEFREASGKNVMIVHMNGQPYLFAEYYSPLTPPAISAAWQGRLGTYQATNWTNWDAVVPVPNGELMVQNGLLVFNAYVLAPVSDTLAYVAGLSDDGGSSVQVLNAGGPNEQIQQLGVTYKKQ
jgi:hypothetical protein